MKPFRFNRHHRWVVLAATALATVAFPESAQAQEVPPGSAAAAPQSSDSGATSDRSAAGLARANEFDAASDHPSADAAPTPTLGAATGASSSWQAGPSSLSPGQILARDFGAIGLTAELNSEEHFGALQARLGAYTALQGTDTPTSLSLQNIVVPAHQTFSISDDARWFVKLGAAGIESWADENGQDLENTTTLTSLAQLQFRPRPGTLIGLGVTYETNTVHLENGGRIVIPGAGLRFDLLQRIGEHLGFAAKVLWMNGHTTTNIPLGDGLELHDRTSSPRTFGQLGLIGMIQHKDAAFLPNGWSLRPAFHAIFQRTALAASTNSLGVFEPRSHQDFGELLFSTRFQKDEFRPGHLAPFVEAGGEVRVDDAIPTPASDPLLAYAKAGAAMRIGGWGFLDGYYALRSSLDGAYTSGTTELLLSVTF